MIERLSKVVKFGRFQLSSGLESPFYVDLREVLGDPELFQWVVDQYRSILSRLDFEVIIGVATGGIPYASVLGYLMKKPFGYVRVEAKRHGLSRLVEGVDVSNRRLAVIDDVMTTGKSVVEVLNAVREAGGRVVGVVVFLDREQCGEQNVKSLGVEVYSVFKIHVLLEQLRPYVDMEDYRDAVEYIERWRC
ncbi:MAG: orotate phosphoribosyltransferase [Pyrobaculum sp.]